MNFPKFKLRHNPPKLTIDIPPLDNKKIPKLRPPKKFKIGDIVCKKSRPSAPLTIWDIPSWNDWCAGMKPQWYYPYEYGLGGTSEGCALEGDLMIYNENNTVDEIFKNQFQKITPIKPSGLDIFDDGMLPHLKKDDMDNIPKAF